MSSYGLAQLHPYQYRKNDPFRVDSLRNLHSAPLPAMPSPHEPCSAFEECGCMAGAGLQSGGLREIRKAGEKDVCVQLSRTKLSLSGPSVKSSGDFCL